MNLENPINSKDTPERNALTQQFDQIINDLINADPSKQKAVGRTLNMVSHTFMQLFSSIEKFQKTKKKDQDNYIASLPILGKELSKETPEAPIGIFLFQMWLALIMDNDPILLIKYAEKLEIISGWAK